MRTSIAYTLIGAAAGLLNGLFGAGGGHHRRAAAGTAASETAAGTRNLGWQSSCR